MHGGHGQDRQSRFEWPFNEKKATQVAARFLSLAPSHRLPYISLIKLMYLADREALKRWASPITNDRYYSLDYGPVLSAVKNLIDVGPCENDGYWAAYITPPSQFQIELIDNPGADELSSAELAVIDDIFAEYGKLNRWDLVDKTHELPEWQNPHGTALPIRIEDILKATGLKTNEAQEVADELESFRNVQALFAKKSA